MRPRSKVQQRDRAARLVKEIAGRIDRELVRDLKRVVDEAQNPPPEGCADGSISEEEWCALRDIVNSLDVALVKCRWFKAR